MIFNRGSEIDGKMFVKVDTRYCPGQSTHACDSEVSTGAQ